jgi:hypothetical protein
MSGHPCAAAVGLEEGREYFDSRRFTGAVRADKAEQVTFCDVEIEIFQRNQILILLPQIPDLDQG